ncbi:Antibiotic biosynthesis monooxygenase [Streptomyces sp. DI166]|uniref:antibiotic biosynthesis monooxygenase n=1 Tax=Streptomyces sp. DI166 TaxID=1839783 RepID=UPI0007F32F6D|nr:antibiotic biosynthesis monooxygenase [Streptomyces sp. DI166]SBT90637.1 Antibiotic biosynthesis monooxygenase [Streptomyces sp. DI166]
MTRRTHTHPDLTRPSADAPFFSHWQVGTPERQAATVEAVARAWERRPWGSPELLSYHLYTGLDGSSLMHHSQWRSEQGYEAFVRTHRQERNDEIDTAVPGIERVRLDRYRRYRSHPRADGDRRVAGLVVTVRIDFDADAAGKRADFVDLVLETLAGPDADPGLIAAHFHLSTDGTHVLNYAEWESGRAYDAAIAGPESPEWARVRTFPGVKGFTGRRYRHALGLEP